MSEQDSNLESEQTWSPKSEDELEFENDELPPSRNRERRDPWHALDDFDDE
ncbi:MAG: hypothetical protein ACK41E_12115 [Deinococcales bacterium]